MPVVALILRDPHGAGRTPEGQALAAAIDIERMPEGYVVGMFLRQPVSEYVERLPAVARARHHNFAIDRHAPLIFIGGHEPSGIPVGWMGCHGEAECRGRQVCQFLPSGAAVRRVKRAVVMLQPQRIRIAAALSDAVRILYDRVILAIRGHV